MLNSQGDGDSDLAGIERLPPSDAGSDAGTVTMTTKNGTTTDTGKKKKSKPGRELFFVIFLLMASPLLGWPIP